MSDKCLFIWIVAAPEAANGLVETSAGEGVDKQLLRSSSVLCPEFDGKVRAAARESLRLVLEVLTAADDPWFAEHAAAAVRRIVAEGRILETKGLDHIESVEYGDEENQASCSADGKLSGKRRAGSRALQQDAGKEENSESCLAANSYKRSRS